MNTPLRIYVKQIQLNWRVNRVSTKLEFRSNISSLMLTQQIVCTRILCNYTSNTEDCITITPTIRSL